MERIFPYKSSNTSVFNHIRYCNYVKNIKKYECKNYYLKENIIFHKGLKVIKYEDSFSIIDEIHGVVRTMIRTYLSSCVKCKELQHIDRRCPIQPIVSNYPREGIVLYLINMSSYNKTNNRDPEFNYILTIVDHYSNYTQLYCLSRKSAEETVSNIEKYLITFGPITMLQSDNGTEFINDLLEEKAQQYNIMQCHSRPYNPSCNGKVERYNQFVKKILDGYLVEN